MKGKTRRRRERGRDEREGKSERGGGRERGRKRGERERWGNEIIRTLQNNIETGL